MRWMRTDPTLILSVPTLQLHPIYNYSYSFPNIFTQFPLPKLNIIYTDMKMIKANEILLINLNILFV